MPIAHILYLIDNKDDSNFNIIFLIFGTRVAIEIAK